MPVLATFSPQNENYARSANAFISGQDAGLSMVERKQQMELQQQREDRLQFGFEAQKPLIIANAQANLLSANAAIQNGARMEQLRSQAAAQSKGFNDRYLDAMQIKNWADRSQALSVLQPEISYMALFPEYKGFVDGVNNSRVTANDSAMADRNLKNTLNNTTLKNESAQAIADVRAQSAMDKQKLEIDQKQALLDERQRNALEMETYRQKGRVETSSQIEQNKGSYNVNQKIVDAGRDAVTTINSLNRGLALLDDPDVRTGTGAGLEVKLKRLGTALGMDLNGVKNTEALQQILGDAVLSRVNQTKGSISDKEMVLFDSYSASINKTPEGNKAILTALIRVKEREIVIAKMVNDKRRAGKSESEIQADVNDFLFNDNVWEGLPAPRDDGSVDPAGLDSTGRKARSDITPVILSTTEQK